MTTYIFDFEQIIKNCKITNKGKYHKAFIIDNVLIKYSKNDIVTCSIKNNIIPNNILKITFGNKVYDNYICSSIINGNIDQFNYILNKIYILNNPVYFCSKL